ncbi:hypothetical protein BROUX41_006141 [Berkeleyomyces rouxiae]|uniref:uncharacterized protein n=1 Tax=Berkeleyomyces rouxiae TaxID=2035830 RepID=UPI003B8182B0
MPRFTKPRRLRRSRALRMAGLACVGFIAYAQYRQIYSSITPSSTPLSMEKLSDSLAKCTQLKTKPTNPTGPGRERNSRYIEGHKPTLIKNAWVWTGEPAEGTSPEAARNGTGFEWIHADVFVQHGLIKRVSSEISAASLPEDVLVFDAGGRPLTAGIIDMHSHAGVGSLPSLWGSEDTNEMSSDITPQMRSIDSFNPLDPQLQVIKSGGVTTSLVLPGSGNNMGGEAFVFKHAVGKPDGRDEISARDMLADPDQNWRYMKMACGENAKRVYGSGRVESPWSRMGESWEFRHAFEQAADLVRRQDDWCGAAERNGLETMNEYLPWDLKWESLSAVLRGQVHVNTHCYTVSDLEAFVDHTQEFKFPIRAFHHAHSTYLVPEILKRAWGPEPPASALFAENMYYKTEAYIGSEFAGKILYESGLTPIYVSDNPVLNAQHVLFEAAKAYKYGLPYHAALAAMTTAPAHYLGFDDRLGKIKPGFDADIVVWDSDPLSAGAAPAQVWIDGYMQLKDPVLLEKDAFKPNTPDAKLLAAVQEPRELGDVVFKGIYKVILSGSEQKTARAGESLTMTVSQGKITCIGTCATEASAAIAANARVVSLENGYVTNAFTAVGGALGLAEIDAESTTANGKSNDFSRAVDGLLLDTKKLHEAVKYGVTRAVTAPKRFGASVGFNTGATHSLKSGAVWADEVALHYPLDDSVKHLSGTGSLSAGVARLRSKLLTATAAVAKGDKSADTFSEDAYLAKVVSGEIALVLSIQSADMIASALKLKATVEASLPPKTKLRVAILGGAEAYLVADELARADVGVILAPIQSFGNEWEERRALTGAPLTNGTTVDVLVSAGVTTAFGLYEDWEFRVLSVMAGVAHNNGRASGIDEAEALDLVSQNVYKALGLGVPDAQAVGHFVVSEGSPLQITSRIRAVGRGEDEMLVFV